MKNNIALLKNHIYEIYIHTEFPKYVIHIEFSMYIIYTHIEFPIMISL